MAKRVIHREVTEATKVNISIKTLIAIIFWVMSMAGIYYTLKGKIDILEIKVQKYEQLNLETIKTKVDLIYDKIQNL